MRDDTQYYSVGFMFTDDMRHVLLIHKDHGPESVIGRWNGIGGHIERGETPIQCQVREFEEETGVATTEGEWIQFAELSGEDFVVHAFWGKNNEYVRNAESTTDEVVGSINCTRSYGCLGDMKLAPNLRWWIPFLRDETTENLLGVIIAKYHKDDNLDAAASI